MKVTQRDMIVLACFVPVVVIATVGLVWVRSRPPAETGLLARTAEAPQARGEDLAGEILDESRIYSITQSGLFTPLAVERSLDGASQARGVSVETREVYEVTPKPTEEAPKSPAPTGPVGPPGMTGPGPMGPPSVARPAAIDVAITGIVIGGRTVRALVESNRDGRTEWVDVPGDAFGYHVKYVTLKGAVLEKGDRTYVLLLGANLKRKSADYKVAGAEGGAPPSGGPPGPPNMDAMKAEMASKMAPGAKFYGGGGGRGRSGRGGQPMGGMRVEMGAVGGKAVIMKRGG